MQPRLRGPLPQDRQAGLPPGILEQSDYVGGALGLDMPPELEDVWDKLNEEAAETGRPAVAGGPGPNLRQRLNNFAVNATVTSELVIPYNPNRIYLMVQNKGAADVFLGFGRAADALSGFEIPAGPGFYEPILGTVSSVHIIAAAGVQLCVFVEGFRA